MVINKHAGAFANTCAAARWKAQYMWAELEEARMLKNKCLIDEKYGCKLENTSLVVGNHK